jgi:flavin reductase (DIM6/NTAB) family NADH-FMN oxidoreductase RutF
MACYGERAAVMIEDPQVTVDTAAYRHVMGHFATGVTVITAMHDGDIHGMTANAITSVSLEPILLLVCFMKGAHTGAAVRASGRFMINVLHEKQQAVAQQYARSIKDGPVPLAPERGLDGVPFLPGALAYLRCQVDSVVSAGDHDIVLARVEACSARAGGPLLYYRGTYHTLGAPTTTPE